MMKKICPWPNGIPLEGTYFFFFLWEFPSYRSKLNTRLPSPKIFSRALKRSSSWLTGMPCTSRRGEDRGVNLLAATGASLEGQKVWKIIHDSLQAKILAYQQNDLSLRISKEHIYN